MNDIMKMVQALEDFNILLRGVTKTIKNETKEQKGWFLSMLLDTLGASLLGNILAGKGIIRASSGNKKEKRKGYSTNNLPKKNKGWGLFDKPWWLWRCMHTLDCFIWQQK